MAKCSFVSDTGKSCVMNVREGVSLCINHDVELREKKLKASQKGGHRNQGRKKKSDGGAADVEEYLELAQAAYRSGMSEEDYCAYLCGIMPPDLEEECQPIKTC
jgi:hypothetical protein